MKKQYTKNVSGLLLYGFIAFLPTFVFAEQTDDAEIEQPRWFEVEIILYKASSEEGLQNESWDIDTGMKLPEELIDFLQPFGLPEQLNPALLSNDSTEFSELANQQEIENNEQLNEQQSKLEKDLKASTNQDEQSTDSFLELKDPQSEELKNVEQEKPYIILDEDLLQLKTEALNISRHVNYDLLAHFSWRQPVLGKRETTNLRIAGGFDYQQSFEFSGEKKLELEAIDDAQPLDEFGGNFDENDLTNNKLSNNDLAKNSAPEESQIAPIGTLQKLDPDGEPVLVALPWVPEIDGSVRIYIHRNYLHLDTDLYYRRPGKEQVDIFDFLSPLPPLDSIGDVQTETDLLGLPQQSINTNDFSWQYDDDFLSEDSEQAYTERLFNYPLKQNRRLRSNQLHYFDHPLIGMLVMIRPYEINPDEEQIQDEELVPQTQRTLISLTNQ